MEKTWRKSERPWERECRTKKRKRINRNKDKNIIGFRLGESDSEQKTPQQKQKEEQNVKETSGSIVLENKKSEEKSESGITVGNWKKIIKNEFQEWDERTKMVQYAYEVWGYDLVALIECENATWNPFRQSDVYKDWVREPSFWLCMIHKGFHPEIVNDSRFWEDWKRQIDTCNRLYQGWTRFYGPWRMIKGKRCSDYVKDRFTILQ